MKKNSVCGGEEGLSILSGTVRESFSDEGMFSRDLNSVTEWIQGGAFQIVGAAGNRVATAQAHLG